MFQSLFRRVGNYQQRVLSRGTTVDDLMLFQSAVGMVYMLVACLATSGLSAGLQLLASDGVVAGTLVVWSVAIIAGTALVLALVAEFSAV